MLSNLRKDSKGYYFIDLTVEGKRVREYLGTKDRKHAQTLQKLRENEIAFNPRSRSRVTVDQFSREFLEYSAVHKDPHTTEKERSAIKLLLKHSPITYLDELDEHRADRFLTTLGALTKKGKDGEEKPAYAPASVNSYLAALKSIFTTAVRWKYIPSNPFSGARKMIENEEEARILTLEEILTVFGKIREKAPELLPFYQFVFLTGCRRTEALDLEWKDIDFDRNLITFRRTKGKRRHVKKLRKFIVMPYVRSLLESRKHFERPFPFKPHRVTFNFTRWSKECGIAGVSLHSLRSSFSSYVQEAGMPLGLVSWIIGHSDEDTTLQSYTGYYAEMIRNYLGQMEKKILPLIAGETNLISSAEIQPRGKTEAL